jgi:sugar (pentulose or hexulose) kinase
VFDIGKSSLKLLVYCNETKRAQPFASAPNTVVTTSPYPHFNVEGMWHWLMDQLSSAAQRYDIRTIIPVTHGATAALMSGDRLAMPVLDYEYEAPFTHDEGHAYRLLRPAFASTFSPTLPCGLNLGRQLWWQATRFPSEFGRVDRILFYPQYWAWRLSGAMASEVTSIGCHTDLWKPAQSDWSTLVDRQGWRRLFPDRRRAGEPLGTITEEVAQRTGLSRSTQVLNGLHDSNASYYRHLSRYGDKPFSVLSTGTWVIAMGGAAPLHGLDEHRDCLANVDVNGKPVPCARFMGGREYEALLTSFPNLSEVPAPADAAIRRLIEQNTFARPSFVPTSGPFARQTGEIRGPAPGSFVEAAALAALYLALMSDTCLSLIGSQGDIHVEGKLGADTTFLSILAALRPQQTIFVTDDASGTAVGAALLAAGPNKGQRKVDDYREVSSHRAPPGDLPGIRNYADTWRALAAHR